MSAPHDQSMAVKRRALLSGTAGILATSSLLVPIARGQSGSVNAEASRGGVVGRGTFRTLASGFVFAEGPLWHPDGYLIFVDLRASKLYRIRPGSAPEFVRSTFAGNGCTFDLNGCLINCEADGRRLTVSRDLETQRSELLVDNANGRRLNRPNDIVCRSDGSLYFTDPAMNVPPEKRDEHNGCIYRYAPDGKITIAAYCEYPNGLAFSPDEQTLYVTNTRWNQYIHAFKLNASGGIVSRQIFADMSSGKTNGVPDGMKVDVLGRVYCTGPGGIWVFDAAGRQLDLIETPEVAANMAFGGTDLKTLYVAASTSIYSIEMEVPGVPHPWYAKK